MTAKQLIEDAERDAAIIDHLTQLGAGSIPPSYDVWPELHNISNYTPKAKDPVVKEKLLRFMSEVDLLRIERKTLEKVLDNRASGYEVHDLDLQNYRARIRQLQASLPKQVPALIKGLFGYDAYVDWCVTNNRPIDHFL